MGLLTEAFVVGITLGFFGLFISTIVMSFNENFSFKKYHYWKQVYLSYFISGFLFHIFCEYLGVNKWYCKNGNACSLAR